MYIKIIAVLFMCFVTSTFAAEMKFEDLDADVQKELLSGLNGKERAAVGVMKKENPPPIVKKKEVVSKSQVLEIISAPAVEVVKVPPAKFVSEPLVVAKKKNTLEKIKQMIAKSDVHLSIGMGLAGFNKWNHELPEGFTATSSDQTGMKYELSLLARYKWFELEWLPLPESSKIPVMFYGSSLGEEKVTRKNMLIANVIAVDKQKYSISLGFGFEQTKLEGAVSIGGTIYPPKVNGVAPVFQVKGRYYLNNLLSVEAGYRVRNVQVTNPIEGVPDLVSTKENSMFFRGVLKAF